MPAIAQDMQSESTAPTQQSAPTTAPQQTPESTTPTESAPAQSAPQTGTQGAGTPATTQEQVAQAVGREFPSYDKDSSGGLSQTEFKSWLGTLRKASEPGFKEDSAEAASWFGQAFTASDADKNGSVSQAELATFLTPKSNP